MGEVHVNGPGDWGKTFPDQPVGRSGGSVIESEASHLAREEKEEEPATERMKRQVACQ